jgi:hypothetical protein
MLCSVDPRLSRPTKIANWRSSASRPASSGGRDPAFGVKGLAIGSIGRL